MLAARRLTTRWAEKLQRNTIYGKTYALRKLLRHIDGQIGTAAEEEILRPPMPKARLRLASKKEYEKLLQFAKPQLRIAIQLMRELGFRWAEALRASPADLNLQRNTQAILTKGKNRKQFTVSPQLKRVLAAIGGREDTRSYVEILHGSPITSNGLRVAWQIAKRRAGVSIDLNPHDLRRAAAVELYDRTHDILAVKRFLGHESIQTTAWYLQAYEPPKEKRP